MPRRSALTMDRSALLARFEAPATRLAAVRILVGVFVSVYLLVRAPAFLDVAKLAAATFAPVGPVKLISAPPPAALSIGLYVATMMLAVAFTLGSRFRVTAPLFAVLLVWTTSYRNSFGMIFHTENLFVVHVVILSLSDAAAAWSRDAKRRPPSEATGFGFGWPLALMSTITVLTYVMAGVAKLRIAGISWITGDSLLHHVAHDNLRKLLLGDSYSPLGAFFLHHPWLFKPLAGLSMVLELFAPLALFFPRVRIAWAASMWSFHLGVLLLMAIFFPYPLLGIAYVSLFPAERLLIHLGRVLGREKK